MGVKLKLLRHHNKLKNLNLRTLQMVLALLKRMMFQMKVVILKKASSAIVSLLQSYKEALASNDESKVADIEAFLKSIENAKFDLQKKMASFLEELSIEKDRILGISPHFDNFRKTTERERAPFIGNKCPRTSFGKFVACFGSFLAS
ncbi:hypothetical protein PTKIN_Ptkin06aG0145600 [Pterospermum kingtungense]